MGEEVTVTAVQRRALEALARGGPCGPAHLSSLVWPDNISVGKGAAPGTGLVRSMLAVLARLRKAGLVRWYARRSTATRGRRKGGRDPAIWMLTFGGAHAIGDYSVATKEAIMRSMSEG